MATLLDDYVTLLSSLGSTVEQCLAPGLPASAVRDVLLADGVDAPDDLVAVWAWRNGTVGDAWDNPDLFWETSRFPPLDVSLQIWRDHHAIVDADDIGIGWRALADEGRMFPGPRHLFPFLMLDEAELMFVDCGTGDTRGALWFGFREDQPWRLFDDMNEAVSAAIYCLRSGLWEVGEEGRIHCERDDMPSPDDRDHPPWRT